MTSERPPVSVRGFQMNRRWFGLAAAICGGSTVGIIISGIAPLLSLNLERLGASSTVIGLMGATPSIAMVSVSFFIPRIIRKIGAAPGIYIGNGIAVAMLLLFPLFFTIPAWFVFRFMMALGIGVALVVTETWINAMASDERRGLAIGTYITLLSAGLASGPILVSITGTEGALPFIAVAVVLVVATLPVPLASWGGAPDMRDEPSISLSQAFRKAPIPMLIATASGAFFVALLALLPVYGVRSGLAEEDALLLMTAFVIGNVGFQIPLGRLLDRRNAGAILLVTGIIQVLGALLLPLVVHEREIAWLLLLLWGGGAGGAYTTGFTMLGRAFKGSELVSANATASICWEVGSLSGPLIAGIAMQFWDPHGLLAVESILAASVVWMGVVAWKGTRLSARTV